MRHLQLTHEHIAMIQKALGMAEKKFEDIHNMIVNDTCKVRGAYSSLEIEENSKYKKNAENFANLNQLIENGDLDV